MRYGRGDEVKIMGHKIASVLLYIFMYVSPIVHAHQLHSCITCQVIQSKNKLKTTKYHQVCKWPIVILSKFEQQSQ